MRIVRTPTMDCYGSMTLGDALTVMLEERARDVLINKGIDDDHMAVGVEYDRQAQKLLKELEKLLDNP